MEGKWAPQIGKENKRAYNGKELDTDFGLNWHHYGFRLYDAAIGRFPSADPIAEKFPHVSSYNYAENSPILNIDLWGLQGTPYYNGSAATSYYTSENPRSEGASKAERDGMKGLGNALVDEVPVLGEAKSIYEGDYGGAVFGLIPGGKILRRAYNKIKHARKLKSGQGILDKNGGFRKLTKVDAKDADANDLAKRMGGQSSVSIEGFGDREFDMVSDKFIGQTTKNVTLGKSFRNQAKATFEAAKETGREVLYEFSGDKSKTNELINKLYEYSKRFDVNVKVTFK